MCGIFTVEKGIEHDVDIVNDVEKDTNESTNIEELHESSLDDSNFRSNVKGFRNWTSRMQQELVETKNRLTQEHQNLIPGSSDFNHRLLREFQKLNPKCMESSRSIYSKLQSIEKTLLHSSSDSTNLVSRSSSNDVAEGSNSNVGICMSRGYHDRICSGE